MIHIIDNYLTQEECDYAISLCEKNDPHPFYGNTHVDVFYSDEITEFVNMMSDRILSILPDTFKYYSRLQLADIGDEQGSLTKWEPGAFTGLHADTAGARMPHLIFSAVLYFNDNFEGGEINFPGQRITHKPVARQLALFRSTREFAHEVLPVISGIRYTLPLWFSTDRIMDIV